MAGRSPQQVGPRASARLFATLRRPGWRRAVLLRRAAALLLALLALALALRPPDAAARGPVVVAARDLPSGTTLAAADLVLATWPGELVPAGALRAPAGADGRVLAGAARAGEPITDVRLAGPDAAGRPAGRPGDAAVPVRLADPEVAHLLGPGSRVDVVTPGTDGDRTLVLATDAVVLTVVATEPDGAAGPGQGSGGRLVLVALPRADAARVAAAALSEQVAVTVR